MVGICYVAPDVPIPSRRGSSTHVLELARALQGLGNQVHVLCRRERFQREEEIISGVVFHRIYRGLPFPLPNRASAGGAPANKGGPGALSAAYNLYLKTVNALVTGIVAARLMKSHGLEIVIERETAFGAGAVASLISKKPMILEVVGPDTSWLSASTSTIILAYNEKMVKKNHLGKVTFVKAAVNTELFKPDPELKAQARRELGFDDSIVVGYVGTFQPWHGLDDLNRASEYLKGSGIPFKFLMVGPMGEYRRGPRTMGGFPSVFTGSVPYETVPAYVNAADILVAPYNAKKSTRTDVGIGSPLKILEYMACGKPTVASDLPQVKSIIEDGRTGLLYPEGDVRAFALAIEELALNESLREDLGRNALGKVRSEFTWVSFAEKILALLSQASEDGRSLLRFPNDQHREG
jgi:glycosyltransferase involved in cell wall biosynthesis